MKKCKFCKRFKEEIKIDKQKGITVQNMYEIMKLSIENLDNADCNIECWLNEDIFLGCDFHISHFNAIPDIVLSFENEEVKKMQEQLSQLQQENEAMKQLIEWIEECDFGFDNFVNDFEEDIKMTEEEFDKETENMSYIESMIHYAKLYIKNKGE